MQSLPVLRPPLPGRVRIQRMATDQDRPPHASSNPASRTCLRKGLYLVTPDEADSHRLCQRVLPLLPFAACVQYRNKTATPALRGKQAALLQALCTAAGVPLIINDDSALARATRAAGVHIGGDDGGIGAARAVLGADALIGVSCYDDLQRAGSAAEAGADYIAFGAFFPSPSKPAARRADPALLRNAATLGLPRVAIGGITPDNAGPLVDAGADLLAVISGVFDAADPVAEARRFRALFD